MNVRTGSSTILPVIAVFAGLTVVLVSCALPSQAGNEQKTTLSNNGTTICPNGWIPVVAPSRDVTPRKLCVRVKEQLLTWERARQDCRASRGFLIKLDTVLRVDNVALDEYLKMRGLDTVWTGMHHEHGTLLWDELQPHMVKAYYGKAQASGWKKRDWQFNFDSFKLNADTCGKFEVHNEDSSEISDNQVANRTRRSPQRPLDNPGVERLRDRLQKRPRTGLDNEEVAPSKSPVEEVAPSRSPVEDKKADILQNSLNQGLQEGLSDAAWDTNTGDTNTAGKSDTSLGAKIAPGRTTVRSINFTDQPNLEDVDDNLRSTKRSSQRSYTKYPVTSAKPISGNSSMRWKNTTQIHNNTTSLPMVSSQTTMTPRSSTSVDDLLNRLLKSSLDSSPNSDVNNIDTSSNSERLDPALTAGNDSLERPTVDSSLFADSQSANKDTSDDMSGKSSHNGSLSVDTTDTSDPHSATSHNDSLSVDTTDTSDPHSATSHNGSLSIDTTDTSDPHSATSHNGSLSIDTTDTSDPHSAASHKGSLSVDTTDTSDSHSAASHNGLSINVASFFKTTTTSMDSATETPNIIHDRDNPQNMIPAKTDKSKSESVTPMSTTNHTARFRNKSIIAGHLPTINSNDSLAKDSHNSNVLFRNSPRTKSARNHFKGFTGNLLSKRSTTTKPVIAMKTPRMSTSTGLTTTMSISTTMSNSTTKTVVTFAASQKLITPNFVPNNSTPSNGSLLSSTRPTTTRNIPLKTTTDTPAFRGAKTTSASPISFTISQNVETIKHTTSSFEGPSGNVFSKRSTPNIPVLTTTGIPASTPVTNHLSTLAASQGNVTRNSTQNNAKLLSGMVIPKQSTPNILVLTTTDPPASTPATNSLSTLAASQGDVNRNSIKHTTSNFKAPSGKVFSKRSTPNVPVLTTTDLPASTPAAHRSSTRGTSQDDVTRNSAQNNAESLSGRVLPKRSTTTSAPVMTTPGLPLSVVAPTTSPTTFSPNKALISRTSLQHDFESSSSEPASNRSTTVKNRVLPKLSTTTPAPVMTTPGIPMSVVAPTTFPATFSPNKTLISRTSLQHDYESSSSEPASNRSTTVKNSPDMTKDQHMSTAEALNSHLKATANQDFNTTKSAPILLKHSLGKSISKRSTTNIPVMTTTDLPTSTVATTTPATSFPTQPSLATSPLITIQAVVHNSAALNTPNTATSINVSNAQVSTDTPVFIPTAETASSTVLATTDATLHVDNTSTGTPVSILHVTETPAPTNASTNTSSLVTGVTNKTLSTFNTETPRKDHSSEVTDHTNSTQYNSTPIAVQGSRKTADVIDPSSNEVSLDSSSTSTESAASVDLDNKHASNTTRSDNFNNPGLDSSSPTSSEVSDTAVNMTSSPKQSLDNARAYREKTNSTSVKFSSATAGKSKDNKDRSQSNATANESQDVSAEQDGSSVSTDEPPRDTLVDVPSNIVSLSHCQEEHASVCVTEAVEELSLVGHCDRNWYGHRLLDRCYKPVDFMLKAIEARQNCLRNSASLATVDTGFYGNITALLLSYFAAGSKVWVDASLNLDVPGDGQCAVLEDGQLQTVDCNLRLPFICQKDVRFVAPYLDDAIDAKRPMIYVQNLTSFHPQTLWCPLRMSAFDDVILWFKDGRPIVNQDDDDATSFRPANGHMPNRLDIDLSILEHLGEGGARIPKPAMLQGLYWCEIFRREPFNRVVSHKIFLKFTDVITLYGHVTTEPANHVTAAIFNRMGHVIGLPALMERRLATLNKNITHFMRRAYPVVRDIITFIQRTNPDTGRSEFTTYVCLATGDLGSRTRGSLVDLYISAFYDALVKAEDELRREWNLTLPVRQALALTMSDMCPEANLVDRNTGLSATFPSTTVNHLAASRDMCNGSPTGSAFCKGDMQSGAYWDMWRVTNPCNNFIQQTLPNKPGSEGTHSSFGTHKSDRTKGNRAGSNDEFGEEKPARSDLVELDQVVVNRNNLADVSGRLADVANQAGDLSATDIETIAQVVHRIVSVDTLTSEISNNLVTTANLVLDAPEIELRKAEQKSNAPSR